GIVLTTKTGISKVYFVELPKEVQERFLPSTPKTNAAQRGGIKLKTWTATVKNPTSFVLLFIGVASLIAAGLFAIVRSRFQRQPTIKKNLTDRPGRAKSGRLYGRVHSLQTTRWSEDFAENDCFAQTRFRSEQRRDV